MTNDNPFDVDESIAPEHVLDTIQWCKKEVGYAKTETKATPNRRLNEVFDRLALIEETLTNMEEFENE